MKKSALALTVSAALVLSACGNTTGDRAASGAGIGAAAGAVVGAVTGLSLLEGVLIGAAAGGLTGAFTDSDTINLGNPVWATDTRPANSTAVGRVQAGLQQLGYNPGPIDGRQGSRTTSAIRSYQRDNGLLQDGRASVELARHIDNRINYQRR